MPCLLLPPSPLPLRDVDASGSLVRCTRSESVFLAKSLAELCGAHPKTYSGLVVSALTDRPSGRKALEGFINQAGVTLA